MSSVIPRLVLSRIQAAELLDAKSNEQLRVTVSPDLGLTQTEAVLSPAGVTFRGGSTVSWSNVEEIAAAKGACFVVENGDLRPIQGFSSATNRFCSLMATDSAPTLLVAGFPMHRIKNTDPYRDTLSKLQAIEPVVGQVLDTATGLGYTAIEASRTAEHIVTIELDPCVLDTARLNPWSQRLFGNPKITQLVGDSYQVVPGLSDGSFSRILHDPPTFSLAGELYSGEFYRQLFRVLARGGRMFHYIGDPSSALGRRVTKGVIRRLREAGFAQVSPCPQAFGVVALKR
jgi:hypothetical protein